MSADGRRGAPRSAFSEHVVDGIRVWTIEVDAVSLPKSLTEAEADVTRLVLEGLSNQAIAAARASSDRTVANQLASIYRKVGVNSRSELASLLSREAEGAADEAAEEDRAPGDD